MTTPVLETRNLVKHYPTGHGFGHHPMVQALNGVSLTLQPAEMLAIVGESGCGKSTLGRTVTRLEDPTSGELLIDGTSADTMLAKEPMAFRRTVQMVFQDPFSSVNPRRKIGTTIADGLRLHRIAPRGERRDRVADLLATVGLSADYLERYPHELSGGQRQRVAIARALAVEPRVIVCDEPVSALDVSIQAQVMNLLIELQRERGVAYLFISHDLALVLHTAHRIAVMYLGKVVEEGRTETLRRRLAHPYSRSLFAAAPRIGKSAAPATLVEGDVPSPIDPPSGCHFHPRCPFAVERCRKESPEPRDFDGGRVACHRAEEIAVDNRDAIPA
ncbi:MAG: peptide ABC transporter ATP-binding protein [Acuticoccus sp.]